MIFVLFGFQGRRQSSCAQADSDVVPGDLGEALIGWKGQHLEEERGTQQLATSCVQPQHLRRFKHLLLEVSLRISVWKRGTSAALCWWAGRGRAYVMRGSLDKHFEAVATSLEGGIRPEGRGLMLQHLWRILRSYFLKEATLEPSLGWGMGS